MKEISVVAAIIKHDDKILCVQRGQGKYAYVSNKFEFPGGKIENNETQHEAIIREIKEELHSKEEEDASARCSERHRPASVEYSGSRSHNNLGLDTEWNAWSCQLHTHGAGTDLAAGELAGTEDYGNAECHSSQCLEGCTFLCCQYPGWPAEHIRDSI